MKAIKAKVKELSNLLKPHSTTLGGQVMSKLADVLIEVKTESNRLKKAKEKRPQEITSFNSIPFKGEKFNDVKDEKVIVVYNPYIKRIAVYFADFQYLVEDYFESQDDWVYITHPHYKNQYLAIHLDYDTCCQLIVYFEEDELREYSDCISWNSNFHKDSNIFIAQDDLEWSNFISLLSKFKFYPLGVLKPIKNEK